jgi:hypothetical protein
MKKVEGVDISELQGLGLGLPKEKMIFPKVRCMVRTVHLFVAELQQMSHTLNQSSLNSKCGLYAVRASEWRLYLPYYKSALCITFSMGQEFGIEGTRHSDENFKIGEQFK